MNFLKNMVYLFRIMIVIILTIAAVWYLLGIMSGSDPAERGTLVENPIEGTVSL